MVNKKSKLTPIFHRIRGIRARELKLKAEEESLLIKAQKELHSKEFEGDSEKLQAQFLNKVKPGLMTMLGPGLEARELITFVAQLEDFFVELAKTLKPMADELHGPVTAHIKALKDITDRAARYTAAADNDAAKREVAARAATEKADLMRTFLQNNLTEGSDLLKLMANELPGFLAENMNNFERMVHNLHKNVGGIMKTQAGHAAYSQGWERVGFMLGNIVIAVAEYAVAQQQGKNIPLDLSDSTGGLGPNVIPIPGPPVPGPAR